MKMTGRTRIVVLMVLAVGAMLLSMPGLMAAQDLLVGVGGSTIQRYTYNTGTSAWDLVGNFVTGVGVWDFAYGPDQNGDGYQELYVGDNAGGVIRYFDGKTGGDASTGVVYATATGEEPVGIAFQGDTLYAALDASDTITVRNSSGTLDTLITDFSQPRHITFGPDRTGDGVEDLYICGASPDLLETSRVGIYGYYPGGGWQLNAFTSGEPGGGLTTAFNFGLAWGPDATGDGVGDLYTADFRRLTVELFNGVTGAYVSDFASGFGFPLNIASGPDGNLYVNDYFTGVSVYNASGDKINSIGAANNLGIAFMPVVPEPSTILGLASGLVGLAGFALRRRVK